jgi:tRNA modification GTPase
LDAAVDFPDDFPETKSIPEIENLLNVIRTELQKLLASSELGFLAKRGIQIVIWGRPNVGKSSLMNRLVKKDRVIVTPFPGTTRDVVEEEVEMSGFPVRFLDTAGIQVTEHPIEKEGIAIWCFWFWMGARSFHQTMRSSSQDLPKKRSS